METLLKLTKYPLLSLNTFAQSRLLDCPRLRHSGGVKLRVQQNVDGAFESYIVFICCLSDSGGGEISGYVDEFFLGPLKPLKGETSEEKTILLIPFPIFPKLASHVTPS